MCVCVSFRSCRWCHLLFVGVCGFGGCGLETLENVFVCVCVCVKRQNVGRLAGVVVLVVLVVVAVFASLCFLALSRCLYLL